MTCEGAQCYTSFGSPSELTPTILEQCKWGHFMPRHFVHLAGRQVTRLVTKWEKGTSVLHSHPKRVTNRAMTSAHDWNPRRLSSCEQE